MSASPVFVVAAEEVSVSFSSDSAEAQKQGIAFQPNTLRVQITA